MSNGTTTDGFDFPCGPPDGVGYYVAAGLAEQAYHDRFGAWHTGEDWNGLGGGDSDLGDPVHATANGQVVTSDYYTPSWGNIVLIEHQMPDGENVWSQYAHLQERKVAVGDYVARGQHIGTIGKGHGNYPAHLHFEIRRRQLEPDTWGLSHAQVLACYAHPTEFIKAHRPGVVGVEVTIEEDGEECTRSESKYWYEATTGHGDHSYWTYTMATKEDCWAEWRPVLPETGLYEVMAFIPSVNTTSQQARYQITHRRGTDTTIIDQSRYLDQWASLGRYPFSTSPTMPSVVRLSDQTGEPFTRYKASRKQIAFDAMRFVRVEGVRDEED
jgi:murein DD-endopeptidase MepM/ murein hydrolase activator NlpD